MARQRRTAEEIINKLREAEVGLARGIAVPEVCRKLGVSEQTYYRWRKEYGGLSRDQAKRLRELEQENARLKKLMADVSLDNAILREAAPSQHRHQDDRRPCRRRSGAEQENHDRPSVAGHQTSVGRPTGTAVEP